MEWKVKIALYCGVCLSELMMFLWGYACKKKNISSHEHELAGTICGIIFAMISIGMVML